MDRAEKEFKAVLRISPLDHNANNGLGLAYRSQGKLDEAIKLYQAANRQPESSWAVLNCLERLKRYDQAIKLTRELESLGGDVAPAACLRAADIYRTSGEKAKEVQQLQLVLRRYPKKNQSSTAHGRLESYGVKLIGGEANAEE